VAILDVNRPIVLQRYRAIVRRFGLVSRVVGVSMSWILFAIGFFVRQVDDQSRLRVPTEGPLVSNTPRSHAPGIHAAEMMILLQASSALQFLGLIEQKICSVSRGRIGQGDLLVCKVAEQKSETRLCILRNPCRFNML
jgi:MFS superfamily sulfate permease-like transporter